LVPAADPTPPPIAVFVPEAVTKEELLPEVPKALAVHAAPVPPFPTVAVYTLPEKT
jgi:hypothetical protein